MDDELNHAERAALDAWLPLEPPTGFAERVVAARLAPSVQPRRSRAVWIVAGAALATIAAVIAVVFSMTPATQPIATVTMSTGPLDRERTRTWEPIAVGGEIELGDAVRTGDGTAELTLAGGATKIAIQKYSVVRFGNRDGKSKLSVELGAIDLSGEGTIGLDVGDVRLARSGTVRITSKGGTAELRLLVGEAQVATLTGQTVNLVLDVAIDVGISIGAVAVVQMDGGVASFDAAVASVADAAIPSDPAGDATIFAVGKRVELLLAPGDSKWAPVEGNTPLPKGAKVRVGAGSTATLATRGTTLVIGGGSRASLTDTSVLDLEVGNGVMTASDNGLVNLPGGAMTIRAGDVPAEVRFDTDPTRMGGGGMKVTIARGYGRLTGTGGSQLDMNRGESATLMKSGQIRPLEAIPAYFDMRITAGEGNFTIHDARPPTAVQFQFAGKCPDGGIVEMDRDPRFRTAKVSAGKDAANHLVKSGAWHYRLRCTTGGVDGNAVSSGVIAVVADGGTRKLPAKPGESPFTPNGMAWTLGYQSVIPDLAVTFPGAGNRFRLHLARSGKPISYESTSNKLKIPGKDLSEGEYTYWYEIDSVKQDKQNTLRIKFDQTAPQVYIEAPVEGKAWVADVDVRGAVLPGWSVAIDGVALPIDAARRFFAKAGQPAGRALAIRLSHPQRGVHYYLRRGPGSR